MVCHPFGRQAPRAAQLHFCIVLKAIRYKRLSPEKVILPKRSMKGHYNDAASLRRVKFAEERY